VTFAVGAGRAGARDRDAAARRADDVTVDRPAWSLEDAFELLSRPVHRYLLGSGIEDPEDALGDVFVRVARRIDGFSGNEEDLRRWVFTVARNIATDHHRRAARRHRRAVVAPAIAVPADPFDPRLAAALGTLTQEQREVIVLRFVTDLPLEDVARLTGRSVGAVKAMQHRALHQLSGLLGVPPGSE
jgi:RNA polymerase sigma-70 factor (ECF subfamily)